MAKRTIFVRETDPKKLKLTPEQRRMLTWLRKLARRHVTTLAIHDGPWEEGQERLKAFIDNIKAGFYIQNEWPSCTSWGLP